MARLGLAFLMALVVAQAACSLGEAGLEDDTTREESVRTRLDAGDAAAREGKLARAEREYLAAAAAIESPRGHELLALEILGRLAALYREGGRPREAQAVTEKALLLGRRFGGPDFSPAGRPSSLPISEEPSPPSLEPGWPAGLSDEIVPELELQEDRDNEFSVHVNLWPFIESTTLSSGEHRTALWPLFHVTTKPHGGLHSWHVLSFLSGETYDMLLPLYYHVDQDRGILPPLALWGPDYWASAPLMSGSWSTSAGNIATWISPLFHLTRTGDGRLVSVHAGPYFEGEDYWSVPPVLSGGWTYNDGDQTVWITPLFHLTRKRWGELSSLHAGIYFQGPESWGVPPLLSGSWKTDSGRMTWVTPLFHWSSDLDGHFESVHVGPYFEGKDYWIALPLAGGGEFEDHSSVLWLTPLFHLTRDPAGALDSLHAGPLLVGKTSWSVPPTLTFSWSRPADGRGFTSSLLLWLYLDAQGLEAMTVLPAFFWVRDEHWVVPPLFTGQWRYSDGVRATWATPLFHLTQKNDGSMQSFHLGPYFEGEDYWAVPPLLSWHVRYEDQVESTWLSPLLHWTTDPAGRAESAHVFPAWFWSRDQAWVSPPLLSAGWKRLDGGETLWITPFAHRSVDSDGFLESYHVGPYLAGEDYWGIPPLLSGSWDYPDGGRTTWITPLFHLTQDRGGVIESLHVGPYLEGTGYWAIPPLLSWHTQYSDRMDATWITPAFHLTRNAAGEVVSTHWGPLFFYQRDAYWLAPPLLSGGGRWADGTCSTWVTPLFHVATDAQGDLSGMHAGPLWIWQRNDFWAVPPLLLGGGSHADGAQTAWVTPLFHGTWDPAGALESFHVLPALFWKRSAYWVAPPILSGGYLREDGSTRTWITPLYHDDSSADGTLRSRHLGLYFDGPDYHHLVPVFWDWKDKETVRHTLLAPPLFVRTEEPQDGTTSSLPWPLVSWRTGPHLDESIGMELRPFLYQQAGEQYELNVLWRMFSVLREEHSTRVMAGPFWHSERPTEGDPLMKFQILGGLFARDCNYETQRYRYRILWVIPFAPKSMKDESVGWLDLAPVWPEERSERAR